MEDRTPEQKKLSERLHSESQKEYNRQQNALCFVVIGSMLLFVGILFIFIAQQRVNNVLAGINTQSLAFYFMLIGLIAGGLLLTYGLIKFILSYKRRKEIIRKINTLK